MSPDTICEKCGVKRRSLHRHHKQPRSLGGSDDPSNILHLRGLRANWQAEEEADKWAVRNAKLAATKRSLVQGNLENLREGWTPEVHQKAVAAAAALHRGTTLKEEHCRKISESLKRAYATGRRKKNNAHDG
jgi:hypothetical protein